jgi:hypothetical protein
MHYREWSIFMIEPSSSTSTIVYSLEHVVDYAGDMESVKTIGIYSSREKAAQAIDRLKDKPGFCENPLLFNPAEDERASGFIIDAYVLDVDNWSEGFGGWDELYLDTIVPPT